MRKLITSVIVIMVAASAHAGDFANAADHGMGPSSGPVWLAFGLFGLGIAITAVFLFKWHFKGKVRAITGVGIVASALVMQAGDFADAADRGYYNPRSTTVESIARGIGRGNDWLYNHPLEAMQFVYHFDSNSSTPRETAGALLGGMNSAYSGMSYPNVGDIGAGSIAIGGLGGSGGYHYTTVCEY